MRRYWWKRRAYPGIPLGVYLIARQKLVGLLEHYGVLCVFGSWLDACVYEFNDKSELRKTGLSTFLQGRALKVLDYKGAEHIQAVVDRAEEFWRTGKPYDPVLRNCEHFARYLFSGELKSTQVNGLLIGAAIAGVALLAARAK